MVSDERAHCSRAAYRLASAGSDLACDIAAAIELERALVRTEQQVKIEALTLELVQLKRTQRLSERYGEKLEAAIKESERILCGYLVSLKSPVSEQLTKAHSILRKGTEITFDYGEDL